MPITHSFIRSLSGLSEAELPDSVIDDLSLINFTEDWILMYDVSTYPATVIQYFKGYKAITMLEAYILMAVPQKIKDNFNEISRFDNTQAMLKKAWEKVWELENPADLVNGVSRFDIVKPNIDPVTNEAR